MTRLLLLLVSVVVAPLAAAQDQTGCATAIDALQSEPTINVPASAVSGSECEYLATALQTSVAQRISIAERERIGKLAPRDIQPSQGPTGGLAGSAAQSQAVPDVRPVALAGGAVAAAGTSEGGTTLTAVSLNPAMFFGSTAPEEAATLARLADLTLLVPLDDIDGDGDGTPRFIGVRARLSLNATSRGNAVIDILEERFTEYLGAVGASIESLRQILLEAPDATACARAVLADSATEPTCGVTVGGVGGDVETAFTRAAAAARREADASYFGLDALLDVGDPSLGTTPGADGIVGGVGIAGARRFGTDSGGPRLQYRVGSFYAHREEQDPRFGAVGAVGIEFVREQGVQELSFGLGIEGRYAQDADGDATPELAALDDTFLRFRGAINVPIGPAYSAAIAFGTGTDGPSLSVSANWQLLLPDRR